MNQVFDFLRLFGRFEYLLKTRGFLYPPPKPGHDAKADWDRFVASIRGLLERTGDPGFREAVNYLFGHPPYRQIADPHNGLAWERPASEGEFFEERLVQTLRRVRNNLFHGEPGASTSDTASDPVLIRHALTALTQVIAVSEPLRVGLQEITEAERSEG